MRFVCSEVIPEVIEICPLAAAHQRFRRRTVEAKMPNARVIIDVFLSGNAREKSTHQNKLFHFHRELCGVRIGDHQSDVVANYASLLDTQRLGECVDADTS